MAMAIDQIRTPNHKVLKRIFSRRRPSDKCHSTYDGQINVNGCLDLQRGSAEDWRHLFFFFFKKITNLLHGARGQTVVATS